MSDSQTKADTPVKLQPHRYRVSVPRADEAVVEWMNLQDNQSLSVRMLIRESIERIGYVDVVNRPVTQLPKRGRPAGSSEEDQATNEDAAAAPAPVSQAARPQVPAVAPAEPEPAPQRAQSPQQAVQGSTPPVPQTLPSEPEQSSSEPLEVNDIFSTLR